MDGMTMKNHSLIHRTMSQFLICTAVIFLLMTPLFYLLTKHFYAEDLIDVVEAIKEGGAIPPLDLERDIMAGVMLQFILTFVILSVAMFITIHFITRHLWRPFDDTLQKAERFSLAQSVVPDFAETDIAEFRRLNDSLTQLMLKNKETYRIQKEFTENASHELQTPLAVTRTKLDLLMQEDLSEEQLGIVSELYRLNTRMEHLNRNLLLLAKIENSQYSELATLHPADFIGNLLSSYRMLKSGIVINMHANENEAWEIQANPILFECLVNNLVVNAIRNTSNGEVTIDLTEPHVISVSNPAEDGPLDAKSLFRRFRPGSSGSVGNGLGLSIVKAICDFHAWTVSYAFIPSRHIFTLKMI